MSRPLNFVTITLPWICYMFLNFTYILYTFARLDVTQMNKNRQSNYIITS